MKPSKLMKLAGNQKASICHYYSNMPPHIDPSYRVTFSHAQEKNRRLARLAAKARIARQERREYEEA